TTGLRFPEGPVAMPDGSLIVVEIEGKRLTRVAPDGSHTTIAQMEGGPNGAAIGPDGKCYVCNNGGFEWFEDGENGLRPGLQPPDYSGGRIERVDLETGEIELLYAESDAGPLRGPNDIVFDKSGGFWFTDIGKNRPGEREHGAVYYARTDGSMIRREIFPMVQPNGIGLSPDEDRLYVAETVTGRVWAFDLKEPGSIVRNPFPSPNGGKLLAGLPGFQLFDSLALDADGNVCVATMFNPGITVISPDGEVLDHIYTGDNFTTNICFGGPDLRTAYITLSSRGEVVVMEWPRPGLPLNFLNT
ncbi:MAG: SMP-30/gluconolactonase/LRE family protein, partial [Salinarimonadaceae bacterium]